MYQAGVITSSAVWKCLIKTLYHNVMYMSALQNRDILTVTSYCFVFLLPNSFYRCYCPGGFTGDNCETDINECSSFPCFNYDECVDGRNGYSCICKAGFSGTHCEVDINECASSLCQNNAICVDLPGDFSCECLLGYEGVFCEVM